MPGITAGSPLHPLPEYDVVEVASRSGGHRRRVAVLGLLCDYAQLYRKSAFNGLAAAGGIEPPIDALKRLTGALRDAEKPDAVVAMTHLLDPAWKSNLQPDFNVRVIERFGPDSFAVLREPNESNRSVQKSAESTST